MCCRSEWQERMYIYKWHEVDQTKHEIFCVHIVCNEIQVKVNLEITTFFFYLHFPYCPNFFWFGVVKHCQLPAQPKATKPEDHIGIRPNKSTKPTQAHWKKKKTSVVSFLLNYSMPKWNVQRVALQSCLISSKTDENVKLATFYYIGCCTPNIREVQKLNV